MTLKIKILRCLRRLFIVLVSLMMTWFSEKNAYFHYMNTWFHAQLVQKNSCTSSQLHRSSEIQSLKCLRRFLSSIFIGRVVNKHLNGVWNPHLCSKSKAISQGKADVTAVVLSNEKLVNLKYICNTVLILDDL